MIWRSTIVFLTGLTVVTLPVAGLQAKSISVLMAQSSAVDPNAAIDTGQATPDFSGAAPASPLQQATSEQQVEEIKVLQQELKNRGYYNGPIDGIYGPVTDNAIRELRGQEGIKPSPSVPAEPTDNVAVTEQTGSEAQDPTESEAEDSSVRINAENLSEDTGEINIGDSVSPDTGTETADTSDAKTAETSDQSSGSEPTQASAAASPGPGLGRIVWPGLALITALGSFGIGFVLANRVKQSPDEDNESTWGTIPEAVAPSNDYQSLSERSHNGHAVANGNHSANADLMMPPSSQTDNSLQVVTNAGMVGATTRLAKVDVIDELVANLQVTDPSKRRKAIWELGQRGNSSAVQPLVNSMVDADSKEKSLILAALSEIGIRSLKPMNRALAIALQDENPDVRKNAIRDLTRVYDLVTQISQMLGHATEDDDPEVRRTAEWALGQLNRIREAPKLQSSINTLESARSTPDLLPDEVENLKN
jgi:peptidoglycan hydrolase-like protein with peptidoglycan-binding domain